MTSCRTCKLLAPCPRNVIAGGLFANLACNLQFDDAQTAPQPQRVTTSGKSYGRPPGKCSDPVANAITLLAAHGPATARELAGVAGVSHVYMCRTLQRACQAGAVTIVGRVTAGKSNTLAAVYGVGE